MSNVKQIIQRVGAYLGDVGVEFRKIAWPDRQELVDSTVVVIAASLLLGLFTSISDFALYQVIDLCTHLVK